MGLIPTQWTPRAGILGAFVILGAMISCAGSRGSVDPRDIAGELDSGRESDGRILADANDGGADTSGGESCSPTNCRGCCLPSGACVDGEIFVQCGRLGVPCVDCSQPGAQCSPHCFDVAATFLQTDFEGVTSPPQIFGRSVVDGETVFALLDETNDETYQLQLYTCEPFYTKQPQMLTWHIERKKIDNALYKLLVRGKSDTDCDQSRALCAGEILVSKVRGWKIKEVVKCNVQEDMPANGVVTPTFCEVDTDSGKITWQAGSICGKCCLCPEAAEVDIEVVVGQ